MLIIKPPDSKFYFQGGLCNQENLKGLNTFTTKKGIVINKQHKIRPLSDEVEESFMNLRELVKRNRKTNPNNEAPKA